MQKEEKQKLKTYRKKAKEQEINKKKNLNNILIIILNKYYNLIPK